MLTSTAADVAKFSDCRTYRYLLTREFGGRSTCLFVMLNPSTADANQDDPTIRRCMGFAQRERFGRLEVTNLYGFRATKPEVLFANNDPVGDQNDEVIGDAIERADLVIVAWGNHGGIDHRRVQKVAELIRRSGKPVRCFGLTNRGQPRHPLYLNASTPLFDADELLRREKYRTKRRNVFTRVHLE